MTAASGLAVDNAAKPPVFWVPLLKDAVLAALVAVLLALPLVGLQTYDIGGGALGIRTHFDWVAIAGAAVFAGRLALRVLQQLYRARPTGRARVAHIPRRLGQSPDAADHSRSGSGLPSPCRSCRSRRAI